MRFSAILITGILFTSSQGMADVSPYAGQQIREIKALSSQDIADLEAGRGLGMAKAAELNGYPGPAHVLELATDLGLTPEQARAVTAIRDRMSAGARPLGAEILRLERDLDGNFASGLVAEDALAAETEAIGALQGRLRAIHLTAHLATRAVLTPVQIARYQELRGYTTSPAHDEHGGNHHHGD
jgi:Spy/CpxP family protein refolding chaperone